MNNSGILDDVNVGIAAIHQRKSKLDEKLYLNKTAVMNTFKIFPTDPSLYKEEYAGFIEEIIDKYGIKEWKAVVLTNEIHGHIGIYSILGAKAGTMACEYFNVRTGKLKVTSYAGNRPPLSCFNDGVQISTGATIGQGLISVSDTVLENPTIICECKNRRIKLSLKNEVLKQVQADIQNGVRQYGHSHDYWDYIEKLAHNYWRSYDRHQIFVIEKL